MGLQAAWGGSEPPLIVATLLDALLGILDLTFVYARLNDPDGGPATETIRVTAPLAGSVRLEELREALGATSQSQRSSAGGSVRVAGSDSRLASAPLGVRGAIGVIVAGAPRLDFPTKTETLLFEVATNQAALHLQQAHLLSGQRRTASELDQWVSQRTSEIAAASRESRLIIDTIPALAWTARPDGSAEFFNHHYLDFVGLPAAQMIGAGWTSTVHPEDLGELAAAWQRILVSGQTGGTEARLRRFDGHYRWFVFRANPLRDESGAIVKWYGINTDIDDPKRAAAAIEAREQGLRQMTETIPAMLWSATPDGAIDYCNTRFLEYTGSSEQEVRGDGWQRT